MNAKYPRRGPLLLALPLLALGMSAAHGAAPCHSKDQLPAASGTIVNVATEAQLQSAIANLQSGTTIILKSGTYNLSSTLYVRRDNVALRGDGNSCEEVVLAGKGMENSSYGDVPHGIWTDAANLTIMNLTIKDVYQHGIMLNPGAQAPTIHSIRLLNTGQQFIKANPTQYGSGIDNGIVRNSLMAYETAPPATDHGGGTGYTNGVDVHAGKNWVISGNRFENFHTPDSAVHLWNPAILMWNGASNTIAENNVFVNVDRAIAFGLMERNGSYDHNGGVIRNNMIYYAPGLFSAARKTDSDAAILVWNSPGTTVAHNTVLTNGNLNKSIEFRFDTAGAQAVNNLLDLPMGSRNNGTYSQSGNLTSAMTSMFVAPGSGNLHLQASASAAIDKVSATGSAPTDVDGQTRGAGGTVDIGADELVSTITPNPPSNVIIQ